MSTSGFLETLTSIFAFLQSDNRPWRGGVIQSVGNIMKAEIGSPRFSLFNSNGSSNRKRQVNRDPHGMRITLTQVNIIMSLILSISMIITYTGCLPQSSPPASRVSEEIFFLKGHFSRFFLYEFLHLATLPRSSARCARALNSGAMLVMFKLMCAFL